MPVYDPKNPVVNVSVPVPTPVPQPANTSPPQPQQQVQTQPQQAPPQTPRTYSLIFPHIPNSSGQ